MKKRRGFSILELIICVTGITMLATLAALGASQVKQSSNEASAKAAVAQLGAAVSQYKYEVGSYPTSLNVLTGTSGAYGPWVRTMPANDPFGTANCGVNGSGGGNNAYCYGYSDNGFAVWSLGKDKSNNSGGSGTSPPSTFSGDDVGVTGL